MKLSRLSKANLNMAISTLHLSRTNMFKYNLFPEKEISGTKLISEAYLNSTESLQLELRSAKKNRLNKDQIKEIKRKLKEAESSKCYLSSKRKF